jgi:MYXO-CTERM domain-containing protein
VEVEGAWSAKNNCGGLEHDTRVDLMSAWVDEQVEAYDPGYDGGGDEPDAGPGDGDGDGPDGGGDDGGDASADDASGGCQTSAAPGSGIGGLGFFLSLALLIAGRRRRRAQ